jgi:hypothetical protein
VEGFIHSNRCVITINMICYVRTKADSKHTEIKE